jgi:hypothetical protein
MFQFDSSRSRPVPPENIELFRLKIVELVPGSYPGFGRREKTS